MSVSALDAYMLLRFSEDFRRRLDEAEAVLGQKRAFTEEKTWLESAVARMAQAGDDVSPALEKAHLLPELESLRVDHATTFQHLYVDALEKLLAGITFHVSGRAPIIEALFPPLKLPALRKAPKEMVEKYARELEKRTRGSYVTRMAAEPEYAFIHPVLEQIRSLYAQWAAVFSASALPPEEAALVTARLEEVALRVELAMNQARLLAEAALMPVPGAFEDLGLGLKPKRRLASKAMVSALSSEDPDSDLDSDLNAAEPSARSETVDGSVEEHAALSPLPDEEVVVTERGVDSAEVTPAEAAPAPDSGTAPETPGGKKRRSKTTAQA